jgi:16S rRNA processing protein RimM
VAGQEQGGWRPARARLGVVGRAHGLDGSFRVDGAVGWFPYEVGQRLLVDGTMRRIRRRDGDALRPIVRLDGVGDRDAAEALRGAALELDTMSLPAPEEDAFYVFDLVGCRVECEGRPVGVVREVLERPANDVLVLDGPDGEEVLLPFTQDAIPVVDLAGRRLELRPGLLDEPPEP